MLLLRGAARLQFEDDPEPVSLVPGGIGLGHQDLLVDGAEGGTALMGFGSVGELAMPLMMTDPRFDQHCRARGIDPDDVRRRTSQRDQP